MELLVNSEKKKEEEEILIKDDRVLETEADVDVNAYLSNKTEEQNVEELIQEINLDKTSRLSQSEIDELLDKEQKPDLVNDYDLEQQINLDNQSVKSVKSVKSNRSNRSNRVIKVLRVIIIFNDLNGQQQQAHHHLHINNDINSIHNHNIR